MKAVLSNRIFLDYTDDLYKEIKEKYTFKLPPSIPGGRPKVLRMYNTIGKIVSLPIGCASTIPENFTIKDIRVTYPIDFPAFKFELREDQKEIYDKIKDSCLLNANPSWGKTFMAIALARKLGQKTLVICHNTILRDQWEIEINKTLGINCGIIGSGKFHYDSPITVSNIQTLRKHAITLSKEFGTIIVDEVHRAPAKIFSDTLNMMKARYRIGLSATLERKDGLHVTLPMYFSEDIYVASKANQLKPEVHIYKIDVTLPGSGVVPWAIRLNKLYEDPMYYNFISNICQAYANRGHKVLMVADRVDFINKMQEDFDNVVAITGKTQNREELLSLITTKEKSILAGTTSIFKEGVSRNELSCLVMAVPLNNRPMLEQLVGRIQRKMKGKTTPIVVDIILKGGTSRNQAYVRSTYYKEQDYKITLTDLTDVKI